jgi:segregation and condensation protein B
MPASAKAIVESILFVANRPLTVKALAQQTSIAVEEVEEALAALAEENAGDTSGLRVIRHGDTAQMSTAPECTAIVQAFLKDETTGELTKPALETLTIIAYRGPITKAELEQIRGVNCGLILRNLQMRGLVEGKGDEKALQTTYQVTMDFVRHLGVASLSELPEYDRLRNHEQFAQAAATSPGSSVPAPSAAAPSA